MQTVELKNGLKVVLENRNGVGLASISAAVNAGFAYEEEGKGGLSLLTSRVMTKGTKEFSKEEILNITEGGGGEIAASSDTEHSDVSLFFHAKNIESQIKLLASILTNPLFDEEEIERQKHAIKDNIKAIKDSPPAFVGVKLQELAFEGQGYGNSILNQEKTVGDLTRDDLVNYFDKHYKAKNMVVAIVGDFNIDEIKAMCEKYLSNIEAGEVYTLPEAEPKQFYLMKEDNNVDQVNLKLCFNGVGWNHPDYLTYKVLTSTISGGCGSSRMFKAMREEEQLVYSFYLQNDSFYGGGLFCMNAGTGKGKTEILVPKAIDQMKQFIEGIENKEVEAAVATYEKSFKTNLYDLNQSSGLYSYQMLKYGYVETSESLQDKLKKITKDDLIKVTFDIISSEPSFIGIGPKDGVYTLEEIEDIRAKFVAEVDIEKSKLRAEETALQPKWLPLVNSSEDRGEFKKSVLSNGLTVLTQHRPNELVACGYWVGAGCENETREENGISHMLEHMVFKGTKSYKTGEVSKLIGKKYAAYLNAFTSMDKTCYYGYNISSADVEGAMHIFGEMVFYPTLSDIDFNGKSAEDTGEKEVVVEEIKMYDDNPAALLYYNSMLGAFGDTALGRKILGTKDSLAPMTDKDLKHYHDKWYVPNNTTFMAVGEVNHDDMVAELEKMWRDIPAREIVEVKDWDYVGGELNTDKSEKEMSFVAVCFEASAEKNDKNLQYEVLATVLGQGKSSKLHKRIVDKKQLASNVEAANYTMRHAGLFFIESNCKHENVEPIKKEIFDVLENCEISEEDFKSAILKIETDKKSGMLSPQDTFRSIGYTFVNTGEIETIANLEDKLSKIKLSDIQNLLKEMVKSKPTISVVGKI